MGYINVTGGNGNSYSKNYGDGGSGGRIAIYYLENTFIGFYSYIIVFDKITKYS